MFSSFWHKVRTRIRQNREPLPLVSPNHDVAVVHRFRRRFLPRLEQIRQVHRILSATEQRLLRWGLLLFSIGIIWLGIVTIFQHRTTVPAVGGEYAEAVIGVPRLVNPLFSILNDVDNDITRLVYSGLMRYDGTALVPDLAESYEISPDKKTYTWKLRHDVVWHDGEAFTAQDVAFTIQAIQDDAIDSPLAASFQGVKVETPDDFTVVLKLPDVYANFLSSLTFGILPEHIWGTIQPDQIRLAEANLKPIGTGPYAFKRLIKDDTGAIYRYELARFANYYGHPAYIATIAFQFYTDFVGDQGAIYALREKKVDGLGFVPSTLRDDVQRKHVQVFTLQIPQYTALFFNKDRAPVLNDKDVRMALFESIDKQRLVHEAVSGAATVIQGPLIPGVPGYDVNAQNTTTSVEDANTILDKKWERVPADTFKEQLLKRLSAEHQAGDNTSSTASSTDGDGSNKTIDAEVEKLAIAQLSPAQLFYRQTKDGKTLELRLVTADTPEYHQVAERIAATWQEVGVKTNITYVHVQDIPRTVLRDRNYDVLLYGVILGNDPDQYPFWHSSAIEYPGLNLARYANKKVDDILTKARSTDDPATMATLYRDFEKILLADMPAIFLYTPTYSYAQSDVVHGFNTRTITHPSDRFAGVTDWYVQTTGAWSWK